MYDWWGTHFRRVPKNSGRHLGSEESSTPMDRGSGVGGSEGERGDREPCTERKKGICMVRMTCETENGNDG